MHNDPYLNYLESTIERQESLRRKEQEKIDLAVAMRQVHEVSLSVLKEALAVYRKAKEVEETYDGAR